MDKLLKCRGKAAMDEEARGFYKAAACDAIWTRTRLRDAGYLLEDVSCPLCGTQEDTLHHRVWNCLHASCVEFFL